MSLVQCPYEEEYDFIYISDEYTNNILKLSGYRDIGEHDFWVLCTGRIFETATYEYALKSPSNAHCYAAYKLGDVFKEGEAIIATDPHYSYRYAREVMKGRFELGEPSIATNAKLSYLYARDIHNGRFGLGETAIAVDGVYKKKYLQLSGVQL